ncbi:MAG: two-component system chemotaxis sensor kinase CheA, partial [Natrialbaceae archaeon]
ETAEEAQSTEGVETASESTEFEPDVDIDTGEEVAFDQGYDEFEEMSASGTIPESSSPSAESESPSIADRESSTTPDVESDLGDAADFSPDVDVEPTADVSGSISPEEPEELDEIQSGSEPPMDEAAETALPSEETGAAEPSQAGQETGAVEIPDETDFEETVETDLESADFDSVDATVEFGPKESTTEPVSDQQSVTDAQSVESGDSGEELGGVEVGEFDLDDQEGASGDEIAADDLSAEIEQADEAFADLDLEDSSSEPDFDGLDRDFGAGSGAGIRSDSEAPSPAEEATPDQAAPGLPIEVSSESEDLPDRDVDLTDLVPTPPEEMVAADGEDSDEPQSVRIEIDRVDDLLNLVEGLVTTRARLRRAVESGESLAAIDQEIDDLEDLVGDLQDTVMDVRLVPLSTAANRLPRTVRDIAREQNKEVAFEMEGGDVEIDRSILDDIDDPLMHLVRNAVDHGIEPPEEREATDKDPEGTVRLSARRRRDRVVIEVEDDGRGLDPNRLRNEAVEQGMLTRDEAESLSDEESYDLVFESGFSTNQDVTDVSGRGVGMDVVSTTVEDLDGAVTVESERGEGTTVRMTLPVSVAISDVLFVRSGEEEFGVPLKAVEEIGGMGRVDTEDGQEGLVDGDERYPLVRLADTLETRGVTRNGDGMTVKLRKDVRQIAIHCDEVRGQQEVVVRPFEGVLGDIPGLSGATVLGEGDVVNILDVNTL